MLFNIASFLIRVAFITDAKDTVTEREVAVDRGVCSTGLALPPVPTWRGISVRLASSS